VYPTVVQAHLSRSSAAYDPNHRTMTVVLLVDNQPLIGENARRMLAPYADIDYHYCKDPASAFDTALAVKPTVVLLDLVMGDFDGRTLIARFRNTPSTAELPLVVLSAREDATLKAEAFAAGANDYLVKFPERAELVARIRHHSKGFIHMGSHPNAGRPSAWINSNGLKLHFVWC
jgi:sigma-B regulation protein RsbU (phosphoserine phosphatase)